jgi:hypothetical protein
LAIDLPSRISQAAAKIISPMSFTYRKGRPNDVISAKIAPEAAYKSPLFFDVTIPNGDVHNGVDQVAVFPPDPVDSVQAAVCCIGVFPVPFVYVPASYLS